MRSEGGGTSETGEEDEDSEGMASVRGSDKAVPGRVGPPSDAEKTTAPARRPGLARAKVPWGLGLARGRLPPGAERRLEPSPTPSSNAWRSGWSARTYRVIPWPEGAGSASCSNTGHGGACCCKTCLYALFCCIVWILWHVLYMFSNSFVVY